MNTEAVQASARPNISRRRKARSLLVQALYQWSMSGSEAADIEAQFRAANTGKIDWEFFHEALAGVTSKSGQLDGLFAPFLDRPLKGLNPVELAILRLGCFELSERIDVPCRVVINECIELAKRFGATDSYKYVNGVLDKLARQVRAAEIQTPSKG